MQKSCNKFVKRTIALTAAFALTVSGITVQKADNAQAASKAPTLSVSSLTLKKGQTKKIKVNANKQKITKVKWKVDKSKLKITKKTKKYVVVKALKTGSASISVTIVTTKKTYTKKVKAKIKKAAKNTPKPEITKAPVHTDIPDTQAPDVSSVPDGPQTSGNPTVSVPPAETSATITEAPSDTVKPDETKTPTVTTSPSNPGYVSSVDLEQNGITLPTAWTGNGTVAKKLMELRSSFTGKRIKFSMEIKVSGGSEPAESANLNITTNYNGYPGLASCKLNQAWNTWKTITFIHRFNEFKSADAIMYFDIPANMTASMRNMSYTILDNGEPDELGGTPIASGGWHRGIIYDLKTDGNAKYYENKQTNISFDVRVKGVENPTGTCKVQSNYNSSYPMIKGDIPLTKEWTHVEIPYSFGTITDPNPMLYFSNEGDITDEMELYIKDVDVTVTGAVATPTPRPPVDTIEVPINKSVTFDAGTTGWTTMKNTAFDSPVEIKSTDTVKAKIKVTYADEDIEQSSYKMQILLLTNVSDAYNSRCFSTNDFVSGEVKELVRGTNDTGDKSVTGFWAQSQNTIPADGKDVVVTLQSLTIERIAGGDTPSSSAAPDATEAPDEPSPETPTAVDMPISLTGDNVESLKSATTLSVTSGVAKLTGITTYDDGFAITVDIPEGTKLQDYGNVKLSVKASDTIYGAKILVGINKSKPSEPKKDGEGNYQELWAYDADNIGNLEETIINENEKYTVPLNFSGCTEDITGTVCLIIGVAGNNSKDIELSDVSLNIPRVKTPITLTEDNTTPLHKASTCTVTDGKAQLTCTGNSDAIVVKYNLESEKKLQDYKGISITFKSNKSGTAYGREIIAAINVWDLTKPNFNSEKEDNWDLGSQFNLAKIKRNIKNDTEITYILDFDFSQWPTDKGDIKGEIALMIGINNWETDIPSCEISNVSLLS